MAQTILSLLLAGAAAGFVVIVRFLGEGLYLAVSRKRYEFERRRLQTPLELIVQRRVDYGHNLFGVTLVRPKGAALPDYRPGQYITVLVERDGPSALRRCYSLASWSARPKHYELGIRRVDKGLVSGRLHRELIPGSRIRVLPPRGEFVPKQGAQNTVLIAGGIGITPLRAMLRFLLTRAADARIVLFHAVRHVGDLCYHDEFQAAAGLHPNFRYIPLVSRPETSDWQGFCGRLDASWVWERLDDPAQTDFYLCANAAMMAAIGEGLQQRGVPADRLHFEAFGISANGETETCHQVAVEGFAPFRFEGLPTLLHGIEQAGIAIGSDCRTGHCGVCRIRVLDGEYRWLARPGLLLADDEILACCTQPLSDLRLSFQNQ